MLTPAKCTVRVCERARVSLRVHDVSVATVCHDIVYLYLPTVDTGSFDYVARLPDHALTLLPVQG